MTNSEDFKVIVEGTALGILHLMAVKGMITLKEDRTLSDYHGRVHISTDPDDQVVTLFINPGEGVELADAAPPRPGPGPK